MSAMLEPDPDLVQTMLVPNQDLPSEEQLLTFIDDLAINLKKDELNAKGILESRMQLSKVLGTNPFVNHAEIAKHIEAKTGNTLVFYPFDTEKAAAILFANDNKHVFSYLKDGKIVEVSLDENSKLKITPADQSTVLKINPYMDSELRDLLFQVINEEFKQQVTIYGEFNLSDNEKAIKAMNEVIKPYILNYPEDRDLDKFMIPFPDGKNDKKVSFIFDENRNVSNIEILPILIRPSQFRDMNMFSKTIQVN